MRRGDTLRSYSILRLSLARKLISLSSSLNASLWIRRLSCGFPIPPCEVKTTCASPAIWIGPVVNCAPAPGTLYTATHSCNAEASLVSNLCLRSSLISAALQECNVRMSLEWSIESGLTTVTCCSTSSMFWIRSRSALLVYLMWSCSMTIGTTSIDRLLFANALSTNALRESALVMQAVSWPTQ